MYPNDARLRNLYKSDIYINIGILYVVEGKKVVKISKM